MDKIAQKKNEKYHSLIAAAFDLFESDGISNVSIDDIVKKAGVAKGTFYLYFQNKLDLISKLILKKATEYLHVNKEFSDLQEEDMNIDRYIKRFVDILADFLEKNKTLTLLIDKNIDVCVNAVIENREGTIKTVYDNTFQYFAGCGFPAEEIHIKMYIFIEMIVSACCNAILRGKPYALQEIKPHLYSIIATSIFGAQQSSKNGTLLPTQ